MINRQYVIVSLICLFCVITSCSEPIREYDSIRLNQIGFEPLSPKQAVVTGASDSDFSLVEVASGKSVWSGKLREAAYWEYSEETVQIADFSAYTRPGKYRLHVKGLGDSRPFVVQRRLFDSLRNAVQKSFYYQRASMELGEPYADAWARPAGHPDTAVVVDLTAASPSNPAGSHFYAPGGWYDAGDYGKYVSTASTSAYYLLAAYEAYSDVLASDSLGIPTSGNQIPDLLEEIKYQLDWLLLMQDTSTGHFFHKIVSLQHSVDAMPHEDTAPRHLVGIQTGTTLTSAAVMALAARVYVSVDSVFASNCLRAANRAWIWARQNPGLDTGTGESEADDSDQLENSFHDEFIWASTELFLTTGEDSFYNFDEFLTAEPYLNSPTFRDTEPFSVLALIRNLDRIKGPEAQRLWISRFVRYAARFRDHAEQENPYGISMGANGIFDFRTSSNDINASMGLICMEAFALTGDTSFLRAGVSAVDYLLGRNAVDQSFITGFGQVSPLDIHKIIDRNDQQVLPIPGFVAGGVQGYELMDGCVPVFLPATTYHDKWGCHSTNEPTIAMQAATLYLFAAFEGIIRYSIE